MPHPPDRRFSAVSNSRAVGVGRDPRAQGIKIYLTEVDTIKCCQQQNGTQHKIEKGFIVFNLTGNENNLFMHTIKNHFHYNNIPDFGVFKTFWFSFHVFNIFY